VARLTDEIKAGVVIVVAVVIFAFVVVVLGGGAFFEGLVRYRVQFADASGLEPRATVRLNGVSVGRVISVSTVPNEPTRVEAVIGVRQGTPVLDSAVATVTSLSLIGDYYLAIMQQRSGKPLPAGGVIPSVPTESFQQLMATTARLARSMDALVTSVKPVFEEKNVRALGETLASLKPLIADVRAVTMDLHRTIKDLDSVVVETREPLKGAVTALKGDLEKIDTALTGIDRLSQSLGNWERVGSRYGDEILMNLTGASENLQALSRELREEPWRLLYRPEAGPRGK